MVYNLLPFSVTEEYFCLSDLDLYDSPECLKLATQVSKGRFLRVISQTQNDHAIKVCLCEDDYEGWLAIAKKDQLQPAPKKYQSSTVTRQEIETKLEEVIEFTHQAMSKPNHYQWGGTLAPNYDCSGLIQAAFASVGLWLPRDSYQQETVTQSISKEELERGDLIFFGKTKINHVALYLGNLDYIHSSGKDFGNNGIGINKLSANHNQISTNYYQQLKSFGRIISAKK